MPAKKKAAKKPVKRRLNIERPRNGGKWTEAQFLYFIKSALRRASSRWGPKYEAVRKTYVGDGINPRTGRKCKLHQCPECGGTFPQNGMQADHRIPVVGPEGFTNWSDYVARLFCEADGFAVMCIACHKKVTAAERAERAAHASKPPGADPLL
jgi:hypothetical protein